MGEILIAPIAVAALVLAVAGVAKLRSPVTAERALAAAGLSVSGGTVRVLACGEAALAVLVLLFPGPSTLALLAATYALLALLARTLSRRGVGCGCFGEREAPATVGHVWLSAALASLAAGGIVWPPHGVGWLIAGPPGVAAPLALGIAGAAYATVLAYTELPAAWSAWRLG